jgi:tetratricopeptide (TPR) repeat protein
MPASRFSQALAVSLLGLLLAVPTAARAQSSPVQSLLQEAQQAMRAEDFRAAERLFREAVAADPRSPDAACGLGQAHMALQQYEEAVRSLESCKSKVLTHLRKLQSDQTRAFANIQDEIRELRETLRAIQSGHLKSAGADRANQIEAAIRDLEQMQNREQVRVEAPPGISFALGTAYLQVGRLAEAERELLSVINSDPNSGEAHNNLAAVYLAQSRFEEARERVRLAEAAGARVSSRMKADIEARVPPPAVAPAGPSKPRTSLPENQPVSLQHAGRTCAAQGAFVQIQATVTPSWGVRDPVVRFRSEETAGWYAVTMLPSDGDVFSTSLPRPRGAESFEYFIEVSGYDDTRTRTKEFRVAVAKDPEDCPEASADPRDADAVLIITTPTDVVDAPPVPPGFSIRGTTADMGVLEIGAKKSLIAGGVALAGATAAGIAVASRPQDGYAGPKPFADGPGVAFVASNPPPESTLSLSSGSLSLDLRIYSPQTILGARIIAELAEEGRALSSCIVLETSSDLRGGQPQSVLLSGPTVPNGGWCDTRVPLDQIRVRVLRDDGSESFRTGMPPLHHLRVLYYLTE